MRACAGAHCACDIGGMMMLKVKLLKSVSLVSVLV